MTELDGDTPASPLAPRSTKGYPVLAWLVILTVIAGVAAFQHFRPGRAPAAGDVDSDSFWGDLQGKYLVGLRSYFPQYSPDIYAQAKTLNAGSARNRLRFVILAGELGGFDEAQNHLTSLENRKGDPADPGDAALTRLLRKLYDGYKAEKFEGVLSDEEAQRIKDEFEWYGTLALGPEGSDPAARKAAIGPARQLVATMIGMVVGGCGLAVLGFVLMIVVLISMYQRGDRRGFKTGSPHGGIYAETFAVWLLVFIGTNVAAGLIPDGPARLPLGNLLRLSSLATLAWPVLRGVSWEQVKEDIGLKRKRSSAVEVGCGLVCYLMALPLAAVGFAITLLLVNLLGRAGLMRTADAEGMPVHPIVFEIRDANLWTMIHLFVAAAIVAPIVEEVFFRGVLHRHLREGTNGAGPGMSFVISALFGGFLFAIVHPQGWLGVPPLMGIAFGISIGREWRGSLIPCMIAHGINNGLITLLAYSLIAK